MKRNINYIKRQKPYNGALLIAATSMVTVMVTLLSIKHFSNEKHDPKPLIVAEYDTVSLPVPVEPIAAGTLIKDITFRQHPFPKHQIPEGAIYDIGRYSGAQAITLLPAHLPLFPENLSFAPNITNPILEQIPNGMRAMTLKVDATSSVEGWAGSGTIVDVLLVTSERTSVVAEKVKILSTERSITPVEGNAAPNIPSTATILVTQEQCLAINTAIPLGKLAFALRSSKDQDLWDNTVYTKDLLKGSLTAESGNPSIINGFITVREENEGSSIQKKQYALKNGKWIKTEVIPEGFFNQ